MAEDLTGRTPAPRIDADRRRAARGACRASVETCPKQALCLERNGLFVDVGGCSECAPGCPVGAITIPVEASIGGALQIHRAFAACRTSEMRTQAEGSALIPCLHRLGLEALAQLYRRGVRELVLASAPCATCSSGASPRLEARVSTFNSLLPPGAMDQVRIVELPPLEWSRRRDVAIDAAQKAIRSAIVKGAELARRALLTVHAVEAGDASARNIRI
jgi:hypothetical protein